MIITNPIQQFFGLDGEPLNNGYIYFGDVNSNPVTSPVTVYSDATYTKPLAQPIRTLNGFPVRSGAPTGIYAPNPVSMLVQNSKNLQVFYLENTTINNEDSYLYRDADVLLTSDDNGKTIVATGSFTQTIDASVTLGENWIVEYINAGTGLITLEPNLSETIDGLANVNLGRNQSCFIKCDGVNLSTTIIEQPTFTVASATTIDLSNIPSQTVVVSGTTTITTVTLRNGQSRKVRFSGVLQLTHSASLVLPAGANYTTTANDIVTFTNQNGVVYAEIMRSSGLPVTSPAVLNATNDPTFASTSSTQPTSAQWVRGAVSINLGTVVNSTSGTSIDFTSIPLSANRITVIFDGVSTNGTSSPLVQLGDSGGIENTGYLCGGTYLSTSAGQTSFTTGFGVHTLGVATVLYGQMIISKMTGNKWVVIGNFSSPSSSTSHFVSGIKELSAVLDRLRITTLNGTDTFDAGTINITWEG